MKNNKSKVSNKHLTRGQEQLLNNQNLKMEAHKQENKLELKTLKKL